MAGDLRVAGTLLVPLKGARVEALDVTCEVTAMGARLTLGHPPSAGLLSAPVVSLVLRIPPAPATFLVKPPSGLVDTARALNVRFVARSSPSLDHLRAVLDLVADGQLTLS